MGRAVKIAKVPVKYDNCSCSRQFYGPECAKVQRKCTKKKLKKRLVV